MRFGLLGCLLFSAPTYAATWTVASDESGDFSSIQSAIDAALSGDRIEVEPGTYDGVIQPLGKAVHLVSTQGSESTFLSSSGGAAVLQFGVEDGPELVVEGFTLVNPEGRGMVSEWGSPTLVDLVFEGLGSAVLDGGAVAILGGNPSFERAVFRKNKGQNGGALHVESAEVLLRDCAFDENEADVGAAIWGQDLILNDEKGTYDFNVSLGSGGAIYLQGVSDASFDGGRFWSNVSSDRGGAVHATSGPGTLSFSSVDFTSNESANAGGALYAEYLYSNIRLDSCHFDANDALWDAGAGVHARLYTGLDIRDSVFEDHVTSQQGGAVYQYYGGDFFCESSLFDDNHAWSGGAARLRDLYGSGEVAIEGCVFSENSSIHEGGGLAIDDVDSVQIHFSAFERNQAGDVATGGGLWLVRSDTASLIGNVFLGNRAGFGGGMSLQESDSLRGPFLLGNNLFIENVADHGGGLLVQETPRPQDDVDYGSFWTNDSATVGRMYLKKETAAPQGEWVAAMDWDFGTVSEENASIVFSTAGLEVSDFTPNAFLLDLYSPHTDWTFVLRFRDASGEYFYGWYGDVTWTGWQEVSVGDVASWGSWGGNGDGVIDLPLDLVQFEVKSSSKNSGTIMVDNVRADTTAAGEVVLEDFEQTEWPIGFQNNSFVANHAMQTGSAVLVWDAAADFRNNLLFQNGGAAALDFIDESSVSDWQFLYNGFYANEAGDLPSEATLDDTTLFEDPHLASYVPDGDLDTNRFVLLQGSVYRDAGDPTLVDPDQSRSDIGSNGGYYAAWVDEDQDGFSSGADCDDSDPTVFPGATDLAYDGVNQDCSLGSDYDQDSDGLDSVDYGGEDCDDLDPSVFENCEGQKEGDSGDTEEDEGPASSCGCSTSHSNRGVPWTLGLLLLCFGRRRESV